MYGIRRGYIIAALPRSGSFLLCERLAALGSAGYPQEYGVPDEPVTWSGHHGYATHLAYFYDFFRFCSTPNGLFGCKLMWPQFAGLRRDIRRYTRIGGCGLQPVEAMTGPLSMVFLDRRDSVAQAISLVRAMKTNIWSSYRTRPPPPLAYDRAAIADAVGMIEDNRRLWEAFFARHAIKPLRLSYEQVAQDDIGAILPFLGLEERDMPTHAPRLRQQADDQSHAWRERFLAETAA